MTDHTPPPVAKPSDARAIRELLMHDRDRFTPRMLDAGAFVIENPHMTALSSVSELAQRSGLAATSFVRLAQALGFSGYSEMQRLFRDPIQRAQPPSLEERIRHSRGEQVIPDPHNVVDLGKSFALANIASLNHLAERLDTIPLDETIGVLLAARVVHVIGADRSFGPAAYLAYALNRVRVQTVQIMGLGSATKDQAAVMHPDDVLVAISFPPYADDTIGVVEAARGRGQRFVAITDSAISPITEGACHVLQVADAEFHGFRALTGLMTLVQTLTMGIAYRRGRDSGAVDLDDINA
jgi:DNA-binding MurR/RpiR family transcriptional regulator